MAEEPNETPEQSKKPKKLKKKVIIILLVVFLVQMIVAYFVIAKYVKPKYFTNIDSKKSSSLNIKNSKKKEPGEIYLIEDIIVNPKDSNGRRFVNLSIGFECKKNSVFEELGKRDILLRDYLISFFSDKSIPEMDGKADKDTIRNTILKSVNSMLPKPGVSAVYFSNFVIQ